MMKTKTKLFFGTATLLLAGLFYFAPLQAQTTEFSLEQKTFTDCWGSGDYALSCTNGDAKVMGCQPDPGSYCVGVR